MGVLLTLFENLWETGHSASVTGWDQMFFEQQSPHCLGTTIELFSVPKIF